MEFDGLHAELTDRVIKIFYEVANELGHGFFESVYRKAMAIALRQAGLNVEEEVPVPVSFRGHLVGVFYADIVVENILVLELKVTEEITRSMEGQATHYLRATTMEIGLILAFGERAKLRRIIFTNDRKNKCVLALTRICLAFTRTCTYPYLYLHSYLYLHLYLAYPFLSVLYP